jgi:FkbM family methyltransferase
MKQYQGIWLPDYEQHMVEWMKLNGELVGGRGTYQIKKLREAMKHVTKWRNAVDVGSHVGFWSMHLARRFQTVHCFEPMVVHRECFDRNMEGINNTLLYPVALGNDHGFVELKFDKGSSGSTRVAGLGGTIELRMLDDYDLQDIDFVKIDCEGYELYVLRGAMNTIERCRPTVIVEQKERTIADFGFTSPEAVTWLKERGYKQVKVMSGDYIMVPG